MTAASSLSQIHKLACQLLELLPEPKQPQTRLEGRTKVVPLRIKGPNTYMLSSELLEAGIDPDLVSNLVAIYKEKVSKLQEFYQEAYLEVSTQPSSSSPFHASITLFHDLLVRQYASQSSKMWNDIINEIKRARYPLKTMPREGEVDFSDAMDRSSTTGSRGHDSSAVQILEQAFRHTPNITQAEKYRLAEVTGLKPKQVTIWFQNRRNRKGKKGLKTERPIPAPTFGPPFPDPHTPSSPPTSDFELPEKKRKSYGALDSPVETDSDSDGPASHLKKPRLPRYSTGSSEASASSEEPTPGVPVWSSPSSRSTSSSSASSAPSDCFDSPGREHNVFLLLNPLKYDDRAKQCMPPVTIASPAPPMLQDWTKGEKSPFTGDIITGAGFETQQSSAFLPENELIGLDFGNLEQDLGTLQRELRESIQKALELSPLTPATSRNTSSSSWDFQQAATDDDGWVDEDELVPAPGASSGTLDNSNVALTLRSPQSMGAELPAGIDMSFSQAAAAAWNTTQVPSAGGDASVDSSHSFFCEDDCFDLNQFFESATATNNAGTMRANSPLFPHQQPSPPQLHHSTQATTATDAGIDPTVPCLDFEVEMADIQDYLNNPSFLAPIPDASTGEERMEDAAEGTTQFYLNFDLSSDVFSLT